MTTSVSGPDGANFIVQEKTKTSKWKYDSNRKQRYNLNTAPNNFQLQQVKGKEKKKHYRKRQDKIFMWKTRCSDASVQTTNLFLVMELLLVAVSAWAWYPITSFAGRPRLSLYFRLKQSNKQKTKAFKYAGKLITTQSLVLFYHHS